MPQAELNHRESKPFVELTEKLYDLIKKANPTDDQLHEIQNLFENWARHPDNDTGKKRPGFML